MEEEVAALVDGAPRHSETWCGGRRRGVALLSAVGLAALLAALAGLVVGLAAAPGGFPAAGRYAHSAVASDAAVCSEHGKTLLAAGGSAADAAVATLLCLGVVHPQSSGLGGGAVFLVRTPLGAYEALDARETAPPGANVTMFRNISSEVDACCLFRVLLTASGSEGRWLWRCRESWPVCWSCTRGTGGCRGPRAWSRRRVCARRAFRPTPRW